MHKLRLTTVLLVLALAACPDRTSPLNVRIIKGNACGTGPDPMQDVTHLRLRFVNVTRCAPPNVDGNRVCEVGGDPCEVDQDCGFGTKVLDKVADVGTGSLAFEQIPSGQPLQVQVTGFAGAPPEGVIISYGQSTTFLIPIEKAEGAKPLEPVVFLRAVEKFSPVVLAEDSTVCTRLSTPRAGHTATLLADGRVLIAGGFDATGISAANLKNPLYWTYKDAVEIFDPATGTVETSTPAMNYGGLKAPRAFHTATRLANGQVLIVGGELAVTQAVAPSPAMASQNLTVLFDPTIEGGGGWVAQATKIARSRHVAVTEQTGRVLFFGGLSWDKSTTPRYVPYFQWYDPDGNVFTRPQEASNSTEFTAHGHAGIPLYGGKYLGVVGGDMEDANNVGKLARETGMRIVEYRDGKMQIKMTIALTAPRTGVAVGGQGSRYLVMGGYTSLQPTQYWDLLPAVAPNDLFSGTDILNLKPDKSNSPVREEGPSMSDVGRANMCAVTLDGRVMVTGGRGGRTAVESVNNVGFFEERGDPPAYAYSSRGEPMAEARFFHTCTVLADGSVLVTGGVQEKGGTFKALDGMEIFVPRPTE